MITRVFKSGNSQAVRLPKSFQTEDEELIIKKVGSMIVMVPVSDQWKVFEESLGEFTSDIFKGEDIAIVADQREEF